jgi:hypothetical protein
MIFSYFKGTSKNISYFFLMTYNERFFMVFEELKKMGQIGTYVELAVVLQTNKAGVNDLKTGKKKLSIDNIRSMKMSYRNINCEFIITGEGPMFNNEQWNNKEGHLLSLIESQQRTIEELSKKADIAEDVRSAPAKKII